MIDLQKNITENLNTPELEIINKKTKKMKKKKIQKLTLTEFKVWLSALEQFQDDNWHPTSDQWDTIKAHMMAIKESKPEIGNTINNVSSQTAIPRRPTSVMPSPINRMASLPIQEPSAVLDDVKHQLKSDIDTSDGNYNSEFI